MRPIAEQLSNEDIRNLGAYFASLPPAAATKPKESSQVEAKAKIVATQLRVMPHRYICRNEGNCTHRRAARGLSCQSAT
jgi:hypothetical protein